ncbi:MAG: PQQ-like beta-propeller repeat protein [Thermoguttaceae bacterium]|nr:PQQ-like beta-propeller repeat protein [Thermoguttaceae bacterium]MDW8077349.1 PQQ-binding-like beta-propeller repeat protein [Thermoguttaceae bacterium]
MSFLPVSTVFLLAIAWWSEASADKRPGSGEVFGPGWPCWRGPGASAVSEEVIGTWPPEKLWEFDLGSGVSSVIAYRGRVYGMGHRDGWDQVYCLDAETGSVIWRFSYRAKSDQTSDVRLPGPRSTPATDGVFVYTLSVDGQVHCLEADTGKLLWSKSQADTGASDSQQYGVCAPVYVDDKMVVVDVAVHCLAYDKVTGRELWRTRGSGGWNGAAPVGAIVNGRRYIIHGTGRCLEADTGRELWVLPYGEMSVLTPVVVGNRVFLAPFHGRNYGGAECVVAEFDGGSPRIVWKNEEVQGLCSTAVYYRGYLYAPDRDDLSIAGESGQRMNLKCLDFNTGQVRWVHRPLAWPSCIIAGGKLLIQTLHGELILAEASPEAYREYGRVRMLSGRFWTVPALADGRLFCRNNAGRLTAFWVGQMQAKPRTPPAEERLAQSTKSPVRQEVKSTNVGEDGFWARFRGPNGSGIAWFGQHAGVPDDRSGFTLLWKSPVPLVGYSSPVIWEDRIFLTGATANRQAVFCYDAETGRLLWQQNIGGQLGGEVGRPAKLWHEASFAAPTPAVNEKFLVVMFASGDVACFDHTGALLWQRSVGLPDNYYGHASSPIIWQDLLILQVDEASAEKGRSRLTTLDLSTGEVVWEVKRPVGASWSTPIVVDINGSPQVVAAGEPWLAGYNPLTGKLLWQSDVLQGVYYMVPSPIYAGGLVVAGGEGGVVVGLRPPSGQEGGGPEIAWTIEEDLPSVCTPVSDGQLLFLLTSDGWLSCHELPTGNRLWTKDFSAAERSFEASPTLVGGRICLVDSGGRVLLVPATREEPASVVEWGLGEACLGATPAFSPGRIYIRGEKHLFCYSLAKR